MAEIAAEIAAKLGISTTEFKAALADANASVKGFGSESSKNVGGLTEAIHETHKSMRLFHQFMVGGGIVEAVKGFFELAIKQAENSKDANDENAEAVRKFSDDLKSMHGGLGTIAMDSVGMFNRVGESIGSAIEYAKDFWEAQITGNRDNLNAFDQANQSEKAAAEQERTYAIEKKQHGEEFKRLNEEYARTQQEINQLQFKQLEPADRLAELERERKEIQEGLDSGNLNRLEVRQNELALLKNEKEMIEAQAAQEKEIRADATERNKQQLETQLKGLTTQQQIKLLNDDIKSGEAIISELKKQGVDTTVLEAQQKDMIAKLTKAQGEEEAKRLETKKKIAGSVQEEIDLLTLQHKIALGIATGPEELRYEKIVLQRKERETELQLEDLAEKAIVGKLTPAEQKRFDELTKQKTKLDEQLAVKQQLIDTAGKQQTAEATITDEYTKQVEEASKLNTILDGFSTKVTRQGQNYADQSTESLNSVLANLKKQLFAEQQSYRNTTQQAGINPYDIDPVAGVFQNEIANVQAELNKRRDFAQSLNALGSDFTQSRYGYDEFTRLSQLISPDAQKKQAADISSIATTLKNVFPAQAVNARA